ncbi:MAG: 50S ribosomal protein L30 [Nevskiales bacterium]|nr:50S ribosomal protein L30 [Nevskiales bacterium]
MTDSKKIKVTLVRSLAKRLPNHKACANGLGLRKINQSAVIEATPENMGMVRKVSYLLKVEEV